MIDRDHSSIDRNSGGRLVPVVVVAVIYSVSCFSIEVRGQTNAPVSTSGMTTGVPTATNSGVTSRQAELMQIRSAAQGALGEATAASMSRSADMSIEERNRQLALESARETKRLKREVANRIQWQDSANAYNKVTSNDMSTWNTTNGGVRVEREVPNAFISALIAEEEAAAVREAETSKKKGLPILRKVARREVSREVRGDGGGFMSRLNPVRMISGAVREAEVVEEQVSATNSEPQFRQAGPPPVQRPPAPAPVSAPSPTVKPGVIPRISGAALVDGNSPVNQSAPSSADSPPAPQPSQTVSFGNQLPGEPQKKSGLFSMFSSDGQSSAPAKKSGGLFGFGKKEEPSSDVGTIDASLFPTGAVNETPTGGSLSGGYTASDVAQETMAVPASTGTVQLPGQEVESSGGGFSFPKPKFTRPRSSRSSGSSPGVPTTTTVNSSGTSYYVVTENAQFMVYGADQMQSEVRSLPAGTVVLMTKPGSQWAGIQAPGGVSGIVQNKNLRPASAAEAGGR